MANIKKINGIEFDADAIKGLSLKKFIETHKKMSVFAKQKDNQLITEAYYILCPDKRPKPKVEEGSAEENKATE